MIKYQRPLANLAWKTKNAPFYEVVDVYKKRLKMLHYPFLDTENADAVDIALRFTINILGIHVAIVGTTNPDHLKQNVSSLAAGPLAPALHETIRDRWKAVTWWRTMVPGRKLGWHGWIEGEPAPIRRCGRQAHWANIHFL